MKNNLLNKIGNMAKGVKLNIQKNSPEILLGIGIVGGCLATVKACQATPKAVNIINDTKEKIETFEELLTDEKHKDEYSQEDFKKDKIIVYTKTAVEVVKVYAPTIILGVSSICCVLYSHNILKKRHIALASAYSIVDRGFKEYRNRVAERFGEEVEKEIRHNVVSKKTEIIETDENGKEKKVKKNINVVNDISQYSSYARYFEKGCNGWEENPDYNIMFLRSQQNYANDRLRAKGILFLNEVYDILGIPMTKAGQKVGWVYNPKNPVGDNYVDFGIYKAYKSIMSGDKEDYKKTIILDFNVDGDVWSLMEEV